MKISFVLIAYLGLSSSVFAVDLTVDQTQVLFGADGKTPMEYCTKWSAETKPICESKGPKTVGSVIQEVSTIQLADSQGRGQDPTNTRSGLIAIRLYESTNPTLTLEEIGVILARVDKVEDPLTIARMHQILEPKSK